MPCRHCAQADADPHWGGLDRHCRGCQTRELANGVPFFNATQAGTLTPDYRAQLFAVFGDDWKDGHAAVKAEKQRLDELKGKAC